MILKEDIAKLLDKYGFNYMVDHSSGCQQAGDDYLMFSMPCWREMTATPFKWLLAIALFLLMFLIAVPPIWPCELVPDEPPTEEAISEGPKGFSGLYEHIYDFGGGNGLITLRRIKEIVGDPFDPVYLLEANPLYYVVTRTWAPDVMYLDTGHGLDHTPQGLCGELLAYDTTR